MTDLCTVIVTGGRYFSDVPRLWNALDKFDVKHPIGTVVEGASDDVTGPYQGADYWSRQWAAARGRKSVQFHAEWTKHNRAAGPLRNGLMLTAGADYVIAFSGGSGTADMIRQAQAAGVPVWRVPC